MSASHLLIREEENRGFDWIGNILLIQGWLFYSEKPIDSVGSVSRHDAGPKARMRGPKPYDN